MYRVVFRIVAAGVLLAVFGLAGWLSFEKSVLGRSILVPDLTGKNLEDAAKVSRDAGLTLLVEQGRARVDEKIPAHAVMLQSPGVGSFVKPGQTVRVVLSLGPRSIRVPDLNGLSARAASVSLTRASLRLGEVSTDSDGTRPAGIWSQYPPAESAAADSTPVAVLTSRGARESFFVMPDFVGRDGEREKERLERIGFRVGTIHYEDYAGIAPNTILKQYPPAGYPCSPRESITFTVARAEKS